MTMLTLKPIFGNKFYLTNNERFIYFFLADNKNFNSKKFAEAILAKEVI